MALLEKKTIQLGNDVLIDVDPKSEFVNFRVGDDKGVLVKKTDLWAAIFTIADAKTQDLLMPVRQTTMVTHRRIHRVQVPKGIKPGGIMTVKCEISVEQAVVEGLAGNLTKAQKRGGILIPGR